MHEMFFEIQHLLIVERERHTARKGRLLVQHGLCFGHNLGTERHQ